MNLYCELYCELAVSTALIAEIACYSRKVKDLDHGLEL